MVAEASRPSDRVRPPFPDPAVEPPGVGTRVQELVAFASYYVAAQVDRFKLTAINIAMFAVLGLFGLAIGVAVIFTAAVLLVLGLSGFVGDLIGLIRPWLFWVGFSIVPVLILGGLTAAVVVGFKVVSGKTRGKLKATYDQRKRDQRGSFGTDVEEQSR